ncbi:MAG: hypothetical protein RJB14_2535 [Pseudomonadota bacterium]|jgi:hypothetical protein
MSLVRLCWAIVAVCCLPSIAQAQFVWHCSKQHTLSETGLVENVAKIQQEDIFQIASLGNETDVIGITLRDLMDVYSGLPVRIGGRALKACFLNDNGQSSRDMLAALGLNANSMSALARKSAIVRSPLEWVSNEADMMRCMTKHHPAVGYFTETHETDEVAPCF